MVIDEVGVDSVELKDLCDSEVEMGLTGVPLDLNQAAI